MFNNKLALHKKIKIGGLTFKIKKLSPSLFLDKKYMFPISNVIEIKELSEKIEDTQKAINEHKEIVRDIIIKSVVEIKYWFKQYKIDDYIDIIMDTTELYNVLFLNIVNFTLNIKKNTICSQFRSIESLPLLSI